MISLTGLATLVTIGALFVVLGFLLIHGGRGVNWAFFTRLPTPVGVAGGGMANAIVGSGKLLLLALAIGVPLGVGAGIYMAEFSRPSAAFAIRYTADLLNGVPSIVMGLFAYVVVVVPMRHFSALAGGFALGVMMIPVIALSSEQFLRSVPPALREGAMALGAGHWQTIAAVVLPAAADGVLTGILLALARVAGETAPLLFTAFGNRYWSSGWNQPIASLPVMIYTYAIGPFQDWHQQAWAAALVLLGLVLAVNVGSRLLLRRQWKA